MYEEVTYHPCRRTICGFVRLCQQRRLVFANDTNGTVVGLYVSPHGYKKWLHNVLHESLDPDEYTQVYFPEEPDYDVYDVRVDFPSEHYDFTSGYNLSTISRIWITYNGNHNLSLNWK